MPIVPPRPDAASRPAVAVLVCGGRDYADRARVFAALDRLVSGHAPVREIIHGGASGTDALAGEWAAARGVPCRVFPPDWRRYGRAAGPKRNARMLRDGRPDLVVAFPGGRGTDDMLRQASAAGLPAYRVPPRSVARVAPDAPGP